ncbi:fatty acid desaturase [Amylibacter ulvae]|uniref:Fatty acid desaturase n=1 Tax=Paramylibacter ulvae TaxID=1651968 RepID=A0ABQ3CZ46_9RHOB|nr:fatty acid desaturase [Amylibacter ulvae]GHA48156.1 fatty acid desaturase [Amylibacter ulvae]
MKIKDFTKKYAYADNKRAARELILTIAFYVGSFSLAYLFYNNWFLSSVFVLLTGVGTIRLYMLQHDCGHYSFFHGSRANNVVGTLLSGITWTPFRSLRYNHGLHHAHIGNLDERDASEIYTMTVGEYEAATPVRRMGYRIYRSAFTLFLVGPIIIFFFRYRWPKNINRSGVLDAMITNALLLGLWGAVYLLLGFKGVYIMLWASIFGATAGSVIPYVQHNFENTYWERHPNLDFQTAALTGTTILDFGRVFDLATANIAYHDLHHLNARIPSYRLQECQNDIAHMLNPVKVGWVEGLSCIRWKLWDEELGKMVGFPTASLATTDISEKPLV